VILPSLVALGQVKGIKDLPIVGGVSQNLSSVHIRSINPEEGTQYIHSFLCYL